MKKTFNTMTLAEALQLIPTEKLVPWTVDASSRPPSATLTDVLERLRVFDLDSTEAAKLLLIDAPFWEVVPEFPLKVWKSMPLESDVLARYADYLITPDYAYIKAPFDA